MSQWVGGEHYAANEDDCMHIPQLLTSIPPHQDRRSQQNITPQTSTAQNTAKYYSDKKKPSTKFQLNLTLVCECGSILSDNKAVMTSECEMSFTKNPKEKHDKKNS